MIVRGNLIRAVDKQVTSTYEKQRSKRAMQDRAEVESSSTFWKDARHCMTLVVLALLFINGCSAYTAGPAPIPKPGAMPAWGTEGKIAVGADPYLDPDRQKAVFGQTFTEDWEFTHCQGRNNPVCTRRRFVKKALLIPVQIFVQNLGETPLDLRRSEICLEFPTGGKLWAGGVSELFEWGKDIDELAAESRDYSAEFVHKFYVPMDGAAPLLIVGLPFSFPLWIANEIAAQKATQERLKDYNSKELRDTTLGGNESAHGFVFFLVPWEAADLSKANLLFRFEESGTDASFVVRLPLNGLDLKEWRGNSNNRASWRFNGQILTDSFRDEIQAEKCPNTAECVARHQLELRNQAAVVGYKFSTAEEEAFRQAIEIANDADDGKLTREEAYSQLMR